MPALSTTEIRLLKETARRYAESSLRPQVRRRAELTDPPVKVVNAFAELGFGLVAIPKDMGGLALGPLAMSLVAEAMAAGDVNTAFALPQPGAFGEALVRLGSPVQRARFGHAFRLSPERTWGSYAFCDAGAVQAAPNADGSWRLNGAVPGIWHIGRADRLILTVALGGAEHLAVVLPLPYNGVSIGAFDRPLGLPMGAPAAIDLHNVVIPKDQVLASGDVTGALALMYANLDLTLASLALGAARAASAYVLSYAEERRQAGSPLAHFHSMGFLLVDMHLACEAALKRVREAASAAQGSALGVHFHKPSDVVDLGDLIAGIAAARAEAEEVAFFVTDSAEQILDDGHEDILAHPIAAWHQDVKQLADVYRRPPGL
jgi:alkylation response protein AidB-like acyl-CoA dehydrogenase